MWCDVVGFVVGGRGKEERGMGDGEGRRGRRGGWGNCWLGLIFAWSLEREECGEVEIEGRDIDAPKSTKDDSYVKGQKTALNDRTRK